MFGNFMKTKLVLIMMFAANLALAAEPSPAPTPDTLKQAVAQVLTQATKTVGDAKDFVLAQLPDVVRQLLAWKFACSLIENLVWVGLLIVSSIILRRSFKDNVWKDDGSVRYDVHPQHGWPRFVLGVFSAAATVVSTIGTMIELCNPTWLQIWIAPKVYLIEYAKDFIK
jgi:hypothetical protein